MAYVSENILFEERVWSRVLPQFAHKCTINELNKWLTRLNLEFLQSVNSVRT
jgi:hypothetical protein